MQQATQDLASRSATPPRRAGVTHQTRSVMVTTSVFLPGACC